MKNTILATLAITLSIQGIPVCAEESVVPQRLQVLLDSYERERMSVLKPVEQKFDAALAELQDQFTKAGRLEDALAVSSLITARDKAREPIPDTRWNWASGGELELNGDGTARHTLWKNSGFWERQKDGSIRLLSDDGGYVITFSDENKGKVVALRGGETSITKIKTK